MSDKPTVNPDAFSVMFLQDAFKLRVVETKVGRSKNGHRQFIHTCELVDNKPATTIDRKEVDINGLQFTKFTTLTDKALKFVNIERKALGLPEVTGDMLENLDPLDYKGLTGYGLCSSEQTEKQNELGTPIINPHTGQPIMELRRKFDNWIVA